MASAFTNKHRFFIQYMQYKGIVSLQTAVEFCTKIDPEIDSAANVKTLVLQVNREINKDFSSITLGKCEVTGDEVLMWINMKYDDASKTQLAFTKVELEYFYAILHEIVAAENKRILYPNCIDLTSTLTAELSMDAGEKALMRMVKGGYFVRKGAHVYLGPRAIAEFPVYLRIIDENCICDLCSELVFVGRTCSACVKKFHSPCLDTYLQNQVTCPNCHLEWSEEAIAPTQHQVDNAENASGDDRPSQRN